MTEPLEMERSFVTERAGTAEHRNGVREFGFSVRPMEEDDIAQSAEIERDAFPSMFPYTAFRHELNKKLARYLVASRRDGPRAADRSTDGRPFLHRLMEGARGVLQPRYSAWTPGQPFVAGFLGLWYMGDDAHIVSVGVRRDYRARGIGELLLIAAIRQATRQRANSVTLEVRPSNQVARNLYSKYGFKDCGVRRAYYSDNREDAIIMTTPPIHSEDFIELFEGLVEAHRGRWGRAAIVLG